MGKAKVLLINMPFDNIHRPSIGLSLLKSSLEKRHIDCDILYLNMGFAEYIGFDNYVRVQQINQYTLVGEWLFSRACYGDFSLRDKYLDDYLSRFITSNQFEDIKRFLILQEQSAQAFINVCVERYHLKDYSIIGFGSKYNQNVSSLALSQKIKEVVPGIYVVFGGANWEGEMGKAYLQESPWIDFAISGEADKSFPDLVENLFGGGNGYSVPGVHCQNKDGYEETQDVIILDDLPYPNYDDYIVQLSSASFSKRIKPKFAVETSRGCWWGEKSHCTFCGLNGITIKFRSKSAERAYQEIRYITTKYGHEIEAVDNILDHKYVRTLLPKLRDSNLDFNLLFEVKANLNVNTISMLVEAGIKSVAIGIESFSNPILEHMGKGTTDIQNIEVLKQCQDHGLRVYWNILYKFPCDEWGEYEKMIDLIPSLWHLQPPANIVPVSVDRFSPYHNDPKQYGISGVRPKAAYQYVYPYSREILAKTAYHFDFDRNESAADYNRFVKLVKNWQNKKTGETLVAVRNHDSIILYDTRPISMDKELALSKNQSILYEFCKTKRHWRSVEELVSSIEKFEIEDAASFLDEMIARRLVYRSGNYFLSLGLFNGL